MSIVFNFTLVLLVTLELFYYRLFSMHVLCIFSTKLTLGIRTKGLHSIVRIVRSRRPVVVPIKCLRPKTVDPLLAPQLKS